MRFAKSLKFNRSKADGWKCKCGEVYYEPEQAQKILLLNKLRKELLRAKLGRNRSNLILRLPKDLEKALNLKEKDEVIIKMDDNSFKVMAGKSANANGWSK